MFLSEEGDWGCGWHAAGEEVVWAPPGGGDVAGPLPHCWLPSRGLKFIDRETEDVEGGSILVRQQAPGPSSGPIVGCRPLLPTWPFLVTITSI